MLRLSYIAAIWICLLSASQAHAQTAAPTLRYDLRLDLPLLALGAGTWLAGDVFKDQLAPTACRLCTPNGLDRSARDGVVWSRTGGAALTSDIVGLFTLPSLGLLSAALVSKLGDTQEPFWVDAMIWAEAVGLNAGTNQVVKFSVARRRPFVNERSDMERRAHEDPDDNVSFYSGHTSLAFSSVMAAGTLATLRRRPYALVIFAVGLPLAGLTGYLRMAADRHYLSDVLTGAVMGSAFGVAVPLLHRARKDGPRLSLGPLPGTLALTFRN